MFEESRLGAKNSLAFQHFSVHSAFGVRCAAWSRVLGDRGHDNGKCNKTVGILAVRVYEEPNNWPECCHSSELNAHKSWHDGVLCMRVC